MKVRFQGGLGDGVIVFDVNSDDLKEIDVGQSRVHTRLEVVGNYRVIATKAGDENFLPLSTFSDFFINAIPQQTLSITGLSQEYLINKISHWMLRVDLALVLVLVLYYLLSTVLIMGILVWSIAIP